MPRPRKFITLGLAFAALLNLLLFGAGCAETGKEGVYEAGSSSTRLSTRGLSYDRGAATMVIDGLIVRPITFVGTVLGTVVFVATLPFSALGGNVGEAAEHLVVEPARFTFARCLGCWPSRY